MGLGEDDTVYVGECIDGYTACGAVSLDDFYDFGKMVDHDWSITSKMDITPRTMWHFQDWGVLYDHGSFLEQSRLTDSAQCSEYGVVHSEWFINRPSSSSENGENGLKSDDDKIEKLKQHGMDGNHGMNRDVVL